MLRTASQESTPPSGAVLPVPPRTLTVNHLPTTDQFAYWREQWCEQTVGVTGEQPPSPGAARPGFEACATRWTTEHVIRLRCRTAPFEVSRGTAEIGRLDWQDWIWLYQEESDGAVFRHAGNDFVTRRGDLLLTDPTVPFSCRPHSIHDYRRWFLPRRLIEPHLSRGHRPLSVLLAGRAGVNGLVCAYLAALDEAIDGLDGAALPAVIDNFCRLLALACSGDGAGGGHGSPREALRAARLRQIRDYVERHLSDPGLSPARAAEAARVSVRQLHLLFEPGGTSFAQHVLARRLEECRAALANPMQPRTVTDIAFAWGFNNLASFYRAFHRQFGVGPGDVRARRKPAAPGEKTARAADG